MRAIGTLTIAVGLLLGLTAASAQPRQIIILRHGEKTNGPDLCPTGILVSVYGKTFLEYAALVGKSYLKPYLDGEPSGV